MNQRKAGVILSYISMGLHTIINFIYIPMLLMFLSKEQYGLYQLVGSMIAYLAVMDFGFSNTTIRYYSRALAKKDNVEQENLLATMMRIYLFISMAIIIVGIILLYVLLPFFMNTLTSNDIITAKYVYFILLINIAIIIPGNIFTAIIQAHEKFVFLKSINILNIILQPLLVFIILHFKSSIVALAVVQTMCNILVFILNGYYSIFKLNVKFKLHKWNNTFIKEILSFSFFIFLGAIVDQIYWKTGQVILGAVVGTVAVAIYSISMQFAMSYLAISTNMCTVFLPKLSALTTKSNYMEEINKIFTKIGRLQFYVVMLMFFGFYLFGRQFILLWVGNDFIDAYKYALILMGALIIPLIQNTGILILQAKNKHAFRSLMYLVIAILNVIISIPLAKKYGAMACALVTASCLLLGQGLIINIYYNHLGITIIKFWKEIIKLFVPMIIPVLIFALFLNHYSISNNIMNLLWQIILFVAFYSFILWKFDFNDYEKNLVLSVIKKIKRQR